MLKWQISCHSNKRPMTWRAEGRGFEVVGRCELEMSQRSKPAAKANGHSESWGGGGSVLQVGGLCWKFGEFTLQRILINFVSLWNLYQIIDSVGPNLTNSLPPLLTTVSAWELANCLLDYTHTRRRSSRRKPSETINGESVQSAVK